MDGDAVTRHGFTHQIMEMLPLDSVYENGAPVHSALAYVQWNAGQL